MLPIVAIVGRPNVGKSTLFNRIIGERLSITDDQPGITRDRIYKRTKWLGKEFILIDTGGIESSTDTISNQIKVQSEIAQREADIIVCVCDSRTGVNSEDEFVSKMLYKSNKPVILAINKVDNLKYKENLYDFFSLGLGEPIAISSSHGIGIGDLLDSIILNFTDKDNSDYDEGIIKFSLIGRPNVGKSSLTNTILDDNRVIVSDVEGTTRDAIDSIFSYEKEKYVVIDTAGLRKKGKVYEKYEKYSVIRALSAINRSDVCIVMINADEGIREQDKNIAGYAEEAGRAIIIVVNKWDLIDKDNGTQKKWTKQIREHFKFLSYAPIIFLSALTRKKIHNLMPVIKQVHFNHSKRIETSILNDLLIDIQAYNQPSNHNGGKLKIVYGTQVSISPPNFVLFVNNTNYMHFSYKRYIINSIRESIDFEGTPLRIILRERD